MYREKYKSFRVEDFDYEDLPELIIPNNLVRIQHVNEDKDSTKIPLLKDLFKLCKGIPMQIDVKNSSEESILLG
jgi:hypothetical protein